MKIDYLSLQALGIGAILALVIYWRADRSRGRSASHSKARADETEMFGSVVNKGSLRDDE